MKMRNTRWILLLLLMLASIGKGWADEAPYVYLCNWTSFDLHVFIDGKDVGNAPKGVSTWFYVRPGRHHVDAYREGDEWHKAHKATWVECAPKGEVTFYDHDF
jgi:hypothetical protein